MRVINVTKLDGGNLITPIRGSLALYGISYQVFSETTSTPMNSEEFGLVDKVQNLLLPNPTQSNTDIEMVITRSIEPSLPASPQLYIINKKKCRGVEVKREEASKRVLKNVKFTIEEESFHKWNQKVWKKNGLRF